MHSNRVAHAAADNHQEAVTATIVCAGKDGTVYRVDVGGVIFQPLRDQVAARRAVEQERLENQLVSLVPAERRADADELLVELSNLWTDRASDAHDYVLRRVGFAMLENGLHDLWRLLYADLGSDDDKHRPNAADTFLHDVKNIDRGSEW